MENIFRFSDLDDLMWIRDNCNSEDTFMSVIVIAVTESVLSVARIKESLEEMII